MSWSVTENKRRENLENKEHIKFYTIRWFIQQSRRYADTNLWPWITVYAIKCSALIFTLLYIRVHNVSSVKLIMRFDSKHLWIVLNVLCQHSSFKSNKQRNIFIFLWLWNEMKVNEYNKQHNRFWRICPGAFLF